MKTIKSSIPSLNWIEINILRWELLWELQTEPEKVLAFVEYKEDGWHWEKIWRKTEEEAVQHGVKASLVEAISAAERAVQEHPDTSSLTKDLNSWIDEFYPVNASVLMTTEEALLHSYFPLH